MNEQDIDLRPYLRLLLRRWRLIAAAALLVGGLLGVQTFRAPRTATATSSLLLVTISSSVNLDDRFATRESPGFSNSISQRDGLRAIALNAIVEAPAAALLTEQGLLPDSYRPGSLLRRITVSNDGDLVQITARDSDQAFAAALADAWARAFTATANDFYSRKSINLEQTETDLAAAQERLSRAQAALDAHLTNGDLIRAEQQVTRLEAIAEAVYAAEAEQLAGYLARSNQLEQVLQDLTALRARTAAGAALPAADGTAALLLRLRLLAPSDTVTVALADSSAAGETITVEAVDQLIAELRATQAWLQQQIDGTASAAALAMQSSTAGNGIDAALIEANRRFEQAKSAVRRLTQQRDASQLAVDVLLRRIESLQIASGTGQFELRPVNVTSRPVREPSLSEVAQQGAIGALAAAMGTVVLLITWQVVADLRRREPPRPAAE
jgi:hypothetical protein